MEDYVVLARKLRPQRFQDLIGQETVARALRNAIVTGRVAHAFIFSGPRGVGKTSAARILTKALNCPAVKDGEPCNVCPLCREISQGAAPDVFEIDAASNRGIDNIRELRENVKYAPAKCAYKTYIIDEVHMLTGESFNALLKTLEEPPPHVKFILATTHPHRIPDTILSRCQRYDFPRIPLARMVDYLAAATAGEGLKFSRTALETIARNSAGGMRDALTAVDQAVAYAGTEPADSDVLGLLGLMDHREVLNLLAAVLDKSLHQALDAFALILGRGHDLPALLEALLREAKDLTLYQALGAGSAYFQDHLQDSTQFYETRKAAVGPDELQQIFYLFLEVEQQIKDSAFPRACFEMALVKACRVQPLVGVPELMERARSLLGRSAGEPGAAPGEPARAVPRREPRPPAEALAAPTPTVRTVPPPAPSAAPSTAAAGAPPPHRPPAGRRGAGRSAATPPGDSPPDPEDPEAPPGELPEALCDDARWQSLVGRLAQARRRLAADLRGAEVLAIGAEQVEVRTTRDFSPEDRAALEPVLREVFGPAFELRRNRDTTELPRKERTLAGRKQIRDAQEQAARHQQALADPSVQRLRRFFPNSRILGVTLGPQDSADTENQDDVQG
jgi:DNA polymerase-3 subunit gamma/tau